MQALLFALLIVAAPTQQDIFVSGTEGYHTFRIPSLLVTAKGSLLAFCEGRKKGRGDSGDIDLVLKRSTDGGKTWSKLLIVADDESNTIGNPCPVVERSTGKIWLLLTHNLGKDREADITANKSKGTRTVWVASSTDDGQTWAAPRDITADVKDPAWGWYATGPGTGVQLTRGPHRGRLVIPCDQKNTGQFSHVIYSDDRGRTWKLGGKTADGNGSPGQQHAGHADDHPALGKAALRYQPIRQPSPERTKEKNGKKRRRGKPSSPQHVEAPDVDQI